MKNKSRTNGWIAKTLVLISLVSLFLGSSPLWANAELDRQYALETVGFLKAWDNVDGLFADYVASAYKDFFSGHSRFVLQDLSKADPIFTKSKIPYNKIIEDTQILGQLAKASKAQSIIRTKIFKEGAQYRFNLDWLHSPKMELIATETFTLTDSQNGTENNLAGGLGNIKAALASALERMIKKVPFSGHVTGRDNNAVTVNIGSQAEIQPGDVLVIATLDDVKKHPLLRAIVDWRFSDVGKIEIEQVDRGISFGKVISEEPGRKIARFQKIIQIQRKPTTTPKNEIVYTDEEERKAAAAEAPRIGWISGGPWIGDLGRNYSQKQDSNVPRSRNVNKEGGGFLYGARAEGQLWLTHEFFADMAIGYGLFDYAQHNLPVPVDTDVTDTDVGTGSVVNFKIDTGYSYLVNGDFFGPKGWVKFGYHSISYNFTFSTPEYTTPTSFNSFFLGLGGDLPIRDVWGARLNLDFGLFKSAEEANNINSGAVTGASDVEFTVGGYYRWNPKMSFRLDLNVLANGADFDSGSNLTHKVITINPSLVMYF